MGKPYKIALRSSGDPELRDRGRTLFGRCRHADLTIVLAEDQPREHMIDTLLHELIHAYSTQAGHNMSEQAVSKIAGGLTEIMLNNPGVFRGLDE